MFFNYQWQMGQVINILFLNLEFVVTLAFPFSSVLNAIISTRNLY